MGTVIRDFNQKPCTFRHHQCLSVTSRQYLQTFPIFSAMNSHNSLHSIKRLVFLTDVVFSVRYEVSIQIYRMYNYAAQGPLTT
jgi:hypothetical protein